MEIAWIVALASISGLIQSILWMGFAAVGALIYLCVIPVRGYVNENDFFRVTLVKLYFEGPKCRPDGSYLGTFNEEYRTKIDLITPDRVFAVMITYVLLNALFFILSIMFYKRRNHPSKRGVALGWSCLSLLLSALDVAFCYAMVLDIFSLRDYLSKRPEHKPVNLEEIHYIPLTLALLSSRFIAGFLWNFVIGGIVFFDALCCRNTIKKPQKQPKGSKHEKQVEKVKEPVKEQQKSDEVPKPDVSVINGYGRSQGPSFHEFPKYRLSMEATTRFNVPEKPSPNRESRDWNWSQYAKEKYGLLESDHIREWEMKNEGYVSDEEEKRADFDHDLRNFEPGQRKIKIVKPPLGKPVNIPVPPPMPTTSYNC